MYVRSLELVDFRGYEHVGVEFVPGPNVLVGLNGVGKTNLIEAVYYVAALSSHRVATDNPLVRVGAERAVIRCTIVNGSRELLVELSIEPGKTNKARLGHSTLARARDVLGALRLVLFSPEDLALVHGDPSGRRRFLDDLLVARQPRYAGVRADYERVLKQRNALLRSAYLARKSGGTRGGDLSTLDVWDTHLARHGAQLLAGRLGLCTALEPYLARAYEAVSFGFPSGQREARLSYAASCGDIPDIQRIPMTDELEGTMRSAIAAVKTSEIERGMTLIGPHRDELALSLGDLPAKGYASHGESWSYALALRLASYYLLCADGIEPVLVLDDVFAELDTERRERLASTIRDASQVLISCAVVADIPSSLSGSRYEVTGEGVRRV